MFPDQGDEGKDFTILFAHITSWSKHAQQLTLQQPEHARVVVEHHAVSEGHNRLESSCREHGYQGAFSAADATERGSSAGVMALA